MMKIKKIPKIPLIILLAVCAAAAVYLWFLSNRPEAAPPVEYISNNFNSDVVRAIDSFYEEGKMTEVISGSDTSENVIALTVAGMTDTETMYAVLEIINSYGLNCTFFLQGTEVAEFPRIVDDINKGNHEVGSFTLDGGKYINEKLVYGMIDDFVYSAKLIERASGSYPRYLLCNNTEYTEDLLKAVAASGYEYVIETRNILNFQSFTSYEMTYNYIKKLPNGSIIEIKTEGVLDEEEFFIPEKQQDVGKEAGVAENDTAGPLSEKERLLNVVEWVCRALVDTGRETVYLDVLPKLPPAAALENTPSAKPTPAPVISVSNTDGDSGKTTAESSRPPQNSYLDSIRIIAGKLLEENSGKTVEPVKSAPTGDGVFTYIFYGISNGKALDDTLERLALTQTSGIFYVSDEDITAYPGSVRRILESGHKLGIALLPKNSATASDAAVSLLSAYNYLRMRFDVDTTEVLVPFGEVTDIMQEAVSASRMRLTAFDTAAVRGADEFETDANKVAVNVLGETTANLKYGSTVYFRLDFYKNSDTLIGELAEKVIACEQTLLGLKILQLYNDGQLAEIISPVYTSERALSYVFCGIENEAAVYDVLERLESIGADATFFVTANEISANSECITAILKAGHEVGVSVVQSASWGFIEAAASVSATRTLLAERFGVDSGLVMLPYGTPGGALKEAVSALGITLIQPTLSVVRSGDENETSAANVLRNYFGDSTIPLRRGDIVYFRLNFYKNSDKLAGDLVCAVKERFIDPVRYPLDTAGTSAYSIKSAGKLLANDALRYNYPVPAELMTEGVAEAVKPGYLSGMNATDIMSYFNKRYIGNPDIDDNNMLPGFMQEQIEKLDTTGRINTNGGNTVFLTFDDWSYDSEINQLLYVLDKHNVKASFFIRTRYTEDNPNLLRAIAAEGHDIGSHTVNHAELSHYNTFDRTYSSLNVSEIEMLQTEMTDSYNMLTSIAGDVLNEKGLPTVRRYFRAPTLAQSYIGMKTVFDCGYLYSVSGDFSTGDYGAGSVDELLKILKNGIELPGDAPNRTIGDGSIVVMHISPEAKYTAEALDIFLTENEAKPESERMRFARLSDYLSENGG